MALLSRVGKKYVCGPLLEGVGLRRESREGGDSSLQSREKKISVPYSLKGDGQVETHEGEVNGYSGAMRWTAKMLK